MKIFLALCAAPVLYLLTILWTGYHGWYFPVNCKKPRSGVLKVACVGDSITYGYRISNWFFHHYPYMLQILMGSGFCVRNFGLSGSTAMRSTKMSYRRFSVFQKSRRFLPDTVVIMLGTNDSNSRYWKGKEVFCSEYSELLTAYLRLNSHPDVFLMTPPPLFAKMDDAKMEENLISVREGVRELADELGLPLIDLFDQALNHADWFQTDGVHLNAKGAMEIAHIVYNALMEGEET